MSRLTRRGVPSCVASVLLLVTVTTSSCSGGGDSTAPPVNRPVPKAPSILTQPQDAIGNVGEIAPFSVIADGTQPMTYQWRRNGTDIAGATATGYTTSAITEADHGALYSVTVTNSAGSIVSRAAMLNVRTPPRITMQPLDVTVDAGKAATFSVAVTGTGPFTYSWKRNGVDIAGAAGDRYTLPNARRGDSASTYSVKVANAAGAEESRAAVLTVYGANFYGLGGFRPVFPSTTKDITGARFRFRIVESTMHGIVFGFHQIHAPGSPTTYLLEANAYAGGRLYSDNNCSSWPPAGVYTDGRQSSLRLAIADYVNHHGFEPGLTTGVRTTDPVNYPVQQYLIDGIAALYKSDAISQFDITGMDILVTIERGDVLTNVASFARCDRPLLPRTYRRWTIRVESPGRIPYLAEFVVPDASGRYLVAGQSGQLFGPYDGVMNFASEWIHTPGAFTVQYWDFQVNRESDNSWQPVTSFVTSPLYDGNGRDYGVRVVNVGGTKRVEFSNRTGNTYILAFTPFSF